MDGDVEQPTATAEQAFLGYEANIVPELTDLVRPMTDATPHPENVRKHKLDKIAQSLQTHGQKAAIIVQASTGHIVKGNGTYAAAQMLGWDRLAMSIQQMNDEEALLYLYDDNRASDLAAYDRKKLRDGLAKMMEQPGLFDRGLWDVEEFEDLDEELQGLIVQEPRDSKAAFATASGESLAESKKPTLPGEKMRDVSIVLTIEDHTVFVERLKMLAKVFGTGGTIATIVEAIKRQASAEAAGIQTGRALNEEAEYAARRAVVKEIRDYISTMGPERSYSGTWLMAQLERIVPYRNPKADEGIVPGQTGAFEEPGTVSELSDVGQSSDVGAGSTAGTVPGLPSAQIQPDPEAAALVSAAAEATEAFSDDELEQAQRDAQLAEIDALADES